MRMNFNDLVLNIVVLLHVNVTFTNFRFLNLAIVLPRFHVVVIKCAAHIFSVEFTSFLEVISISVPIYVVGAYLSVTLST